MRAATVARKVTRKARAKIDPSRRARTDTLRRVGAELAVHAPGADLEGQSETARSLAAKFAPATDLPAQLPLFWWTTSANYGDLLSPWLVGRMAQKPVVHADSVAGEHFLAVGSVAARGNAQSTVWGSGLASGEQKWNLPTSPAFRAVRGPLTRALLRNVGAEVPRVFGDPALLAPLYFWPEVEQTHEIGVVVRWSETAWRDLPVGRGVKLIDFGTSDVSGTTRDLLSCRRIVSSSLHGLVVADAYGIPNAWLDSDGHAGGSRPAGGEFKFYDYMLTVNKVRHPQAYDLASQPLTVEALAALEYDDRDTDFDAEALLDASPFVERR